MTTERRREGNLANIAIIERDLIAWLEARQPSYDEAIAALGGALIDVARRAGQCEDAAEAMQGLSETLKEHALSK